MWKEDRQFQEGLHWACTEPWGGVLAPPSSDGKRLPPARREPMCPAANLG